MILTILSFYSFYLVSCLDDGTGDNWKCIKNKNQIYYKLRKNENGNTECATNKPNKCYYTKNLQVCENFQPKGTLGCKPEKKLIIDRSPKSFRRKKQKKFDFCDLLKTPSYARKTLITGGKAAYKGEFPFMVRLSIFKDDKSIVHDQESTCGGSMIQQNWVLTAGHCLYEEYDEHEKIPFESITALIGAHGRKDGKKFVVKQSGVLLNDASVHVQTYHNIVIMIYFIE